MSDTSSGSTLWEKQAPGRVHKPEAVKPAKAPAAKKAPAKKK
jgi:hypothetical protein|tara:strand:+ start:394 stop:519 length:126 start_codon:yes stop_codon:yes gene_type:complete